MPELPEVQTIVNDLKNNIVGYSFVKTWVAQGYSKIKNPAEFANRIVGHKVIDVIRVAKNILIELDTTDYLHIHLAMTGQVFLLEPQQKAGKRAHVVFHIKQGNTSKILTFSDVRMFGKVEILTNAEVKTLHDKYGIEPISEELNTGKLYEKLKNKKTIIKNILMDQKIIAGLGNIYTTEALFMARTWSMA